MSLLTNVCQATFVSFSELYKPVKFLGFYQYFWSTHLETLGRFRERTLSSLETTVRPETFGYRLSLACKLGESGAPCDHRGRSLPWGPGESVAAIHRFQRNLLHDTRLGPSFSPWLMKYRVKRETRYHEAERLPRSGSGIARREGKTFWWKAKPVDGVKPAGLNAGRRSFMAAPAGRHNRDNFAAGFHFSLYRRFE